MRLGQQEEELESWRAGQRGSGWRTILPGEDSKNS